MKKNWWLWVSDDAGAAGICGCLSDGRECRSRYQRGEAPQQSSGKIPVTARAPEVCQPWANFF